MRLKNLILAAGLALALPCVSNAATVDFDYAFTAGPAQYVGPGAGGIVFDSGDLRLTVTAFNYTSDNPLVLGNEIGVDLITGAQGGLGACSVGDANGCGGEPNLDSGTAPELLKFTFTSISTGLLVDVTINIVDFNITNSNESFDGWSGTPLVIALDDEDVNHGGPVTTSGQVEVNLGPTSLFAFGIDDCVDTVGGTPCRPDNTDQVRIGRLIGSYEVAAVPIPAAGFMLIGALGGLGALRRRRKAA